jgi:hypothetical protein
MNFSRAKITLFPHTGSHKAFPLRLLQPVNAGMMARWICQELIHAGGVAF